MIKKLNLILPIVAGIAVASAGFYVAFLTKILDNFSAEFFLYGSVVALSVCVLSTLWLIRFAKLTGKNLPEFEHIPKDNQDTN